MWPARRSFSEGSEQFFGAPSPRGLNLDADARIERGKDEQMAKFLRADIDSTLVPTSEQLITRKSLAARWQCSVETIKRRTAAGQLHPIRFGPRMLRYALEEVRRVERDGAGGSM